MRAAARLTPRMAAYQLKRLVRNKIVPKLATHYDRTIRATAARLPLPTYCDRIPLDLASFIGAYYHHTDVEMHDAARGRFSILGRTVDFESIGGIDWSYRLPDENDIHLWRLKLAHLEVIHSLIASSDPTHHKTAIALLNSYTEYHTFASDDAFAIGWSTYGASHRLLAILSGLSIALQKGSIAADARADLEEFAQLDAGFVWQNIEHELRNNHTERNLAALCLYHLAAGPISSARAKVLDREVGRIIRATVLADGMQIERSAMYQGLTVMSLRIFGACPFLSAATRELASEGADAAIRAWLFLTHSDGEIALFNDSWIGEVPPPRTILDSDSFTLPPALPEAGYFRLTAGSVVAILDAGDIGPRWNPGHGHSDFLALEVDAHGRRFIVDPGTSQYSSGPQRAYERSSASHNGPRYSGVEPVEYSGSFKVGKLNRAVPLQATILAKLSVAAIGGRIRTSAGSCTRVACALPSGGLVVVDRWGSPQPAGATNILIPSEWRINTESPTVLRARSADAETTLAVYQGQLSAVDATTWSRHYMQTERALSVTLEPAHEPTGSQQLVFGIGVVRPSEVPAIRAEVETHIAGQ
jgi:Heparinase II/III-like protein